MGGNESPGILLSLCVSCKLCSAALVDIVMGQFCEVANEKLAILISQWSHKLSTSQQTRNVHGCLIPSMYDDMVALAIDIVGKFGLLDEFDALRDERREMANGVRVLDDDSLGRDEVRGLNRSHLRQQLLVQYKVVF